MKARIYNFMMDYFPYKIMYKVVWMDSQHKIFVPRWGWSKKQSEYAKKYAEDKIHLFE